MCEPGTPGNGDAPAEPAPEEVKTVRGNCWHGAHKLSEECGELVQVLGKLAVYPSGDHPDGKGSLITRLEEEIADVMAAQAYVIGANPQLSMLRIQRRMEQKHAKFCEWGLDGYHMEAPHGDR